MGLILAGFRIIKPAYDFVLQTASKINTITLQREMERYVKDCFQVFKPLRHTFKTVCEIQDDMYSLCVGDWLRVKGYWQKYGSIAEDPENFFHIVRNYGDCIKPHVRKVIREDFSKLVNLTQQLKPYNDVLVRVDVPEMEVWEPYCSQYSPEEGIRITPIKINAIGVKTTHPFNIILFKGDNEITRSIASESKIMLFEDVISYVVDLFRKAEAKISEVREHNEKVMKEMESVVSPWKITNSLKQ